MLLLEEDNSEDSGLGRISQTVLMAFNPPLSKTVFQLDNFEELPVEAAAQALEGLIIDVDGTLTTPGNQELSPEIMQKLAEIRKKMPVCIFGRDMWQFRKLGIPVVRHVAPKPNPTGFKIAAQLYLVQARNGHSINPTKCAMVGDDYSTDGGCRGTGMKFIHVKPRIEDSDHETFIKRATRSTSGTIAEFHDKLRDRAKNKRKK
jgi:predicted HAD superfamily phosphohydrolase YqeG